MEGAKEKKSSKDQQNNTTMTRNGGRQEGGVALGGKTDSILDMLHLWGQ